MKKIFCYYSAATNFCSAKCDNALKTLFLFLMAVSMTDLITA